ncbi:MAG: sigma-54-dependent Fis family transcriptional regulator [bacterium]|nr:sigma-54-dependent Fis family transcriptional regulator [bacterium]
MNRILIVDDVEAMRQQYAYDLERLGDYTTLQADGGSAALVILKDEPVDCVLLDLEMPGVDGFEVLRTLRHEGFAAPVIVYTGTGNIDRCVKAMKLGAWSFIEKGDDFRRVLIEIEKALTAAGREREIARTRRSSSVPLIGESAAMAKMKLGIEQLAPIPSTVLIQGESGSGKELVAKMLHDLSGRGGVHLPVNCAAFTEQLLEDELFGHVRGAFTGADRARKGAFEEAAGGTLFLDEIGEMPLPAQAKLLRVLESKQIQLLGSSKPVKVTARVIAATNRDLAREVEEGRFRRDLLFRLNVHLVQVPPLRDRLGDVPLIAKHLIEKTCRDWGLPVAAITPGAVKSLQTHDWRQNNVRELRNMIERMVIAAGGGPLGEEHLPLDLPGGGDEPVGEEEARSFRHQRIQAERRIITEALERNGNQVTKTAADLGLADHSSLIKIMKRLGLERS